MSENQDDLLLAGMVEGTMHAYEQLFKKYYRLLCIQAYYLLGDEMEAEDVVQNLFITFWQDQLFRQVNSSVKNYLQRAVYNKCLNELEKRRVSNNRLREYVYGKEIHVENDTIERKETAEMMESFLEKLPNQRLEAFTLVYLEDKRYKEAAEKMGISVNSIKTHLKLAVKALQKYKINLK